MPTKRNSAGQQQPYVPAGHGDASGEYGEHATGSNVHYASPDDVKRQLGFSDEPKNIKDKLNGEREETKKPTNNEKLGIDYVEDITNHIKQYSTLPTPTAKVVEESLKVMNNECLEAISKNQKNTFIFYKSGTQTCYVVGKQDLILEKKTMLNENYAKGGVLAHEMGHSLDYTCGLSSRSEIPASAGYYSKEGHNTIKELREIEIKNIDWQSIKREMVEERNSLRSKLLEEEGLNLNGFDNIYDKISKEQDAETIELDEKIKDLQTKAEEVWKNFISGKEKDFEKVKTAREPLQQLNQQRMEKRQAIFKKYNKEVEKYENIDDKVRNFINTKYGDISDIYSSYSGTPLGISGMCHSSRYWGQNPNNAATEFFAEAFQAKSVNPESYKILNKYFPRTMKVFEEIVREVRK